jgi:hypothetical protein
MIACHPRVTTLARDILHPMNLYEELESSYSLVSSPRASSQQASPLVGSESPAFTTLTYQRAVNVDGLCPYVVTIKSCIVTTILEKSMKI